jgi:hypothetical protein
MELVSPRFSKQLLQTNTFCVMRASIYFFRFRFPFFFFFFLKPIQNTMLEALNTRRIVLHLSNPHNGWHMEMMFRSNAIIWDSILAIHFSAWAPNWQVKGLGSNPKHKQKCNMDQLIEKLCSSYEITNNKI